VSTVVVTGSSGLVGSAAASFFSQKGFDVVGIDNDSRKMFFGEEASTKATGLELQAKLDNFLLHEVDIRDFGLIDRIFSPLGEEIYAVIHCAAQPSHDWAARDPMTDFGINAVGTLNLLEATRRHSPSARFIFMSTNKVYGDRPNSFEYDEMDSRWSPPEASRWAHGFDESLSIDDSTHSLFGVSKASADLLVQEYGRYFGLKTAVFRGGCLTGPDHAGVALHGFLSYLVKCVVLGKTYTVFGHKGKQVRDNIHTKDLIEAFWLFVQNPSEGAVFNIGGGNDANVSMMEAIEIAQGIARRNLDFQISNEARKGDHIWYVSDTSKLQAAYPEWKVTVGIQQILEEMVEREQNNIQS
jgi:CDP-paratose 2-epimerase